MRKAAAVVIFESIQFSGKASSSSHHEVFLAKQNSKVTGKLKPSIFSAPGSVLIKTHNCEFTGRGVVVVLIKTSTDNTVVCRGVTNHWTEDDWTGLEETHKSVKLRNKIEHTYKTSS